MRDLEVGESFFVRYSVGEPQANPYMDRILFNAYTEEQFTKLMIQGIEKARDKAQATRNVYLENPEMLNMLDNESVYREELLAHYFDIGLMFPSDTIGVDLAGPDCEYYTFSPGDSPGMTDISGDSFEPVSYTHLRAHETREDLVCRLLLEKKK